MVLFENIVSLVHFHHLRSPQDIRRRYRQLYYTAPSIGQYVSGAIMFKETLYQCTDEGVSFVEALGKQGILAGIKVDEVGADMTMRDGHTIFWCIMIWQLLKEEIHCTNPCILMRE